MPGVKMVDAIADIGFDWMAWLIDPAKRRLGIMQMQ
jgi:hypothetical protein